MRRGRKQIISRMNHPTQFVGRDRDYNPRDGFVAAGAARRTGFRVGGMSIVGNASAIDIKHRLVVDAV